MTEKDWKKTDVINGKDTGRQILAFLSHVIVVFFVGFIFWGFCIIMIKVAKVEPQQTINYFNENLAIPLIIFVTGFFLAWYQKYIWVNEPPNQVRVTINQLYSRFEKGKGSEFTVYFPSFAFKFPFENEGFTDDIEREQVEKTGIFTVTIGRIGLEMEIFITWLPQIENLSKWFQNGDDKEKRKEILQQVKALAIQECETICSNAEKYLDSKEVKNKQAKIANQIAKNIKDRASRYGIQIVEVTFNKCDWSGKTQEMLNKAFGAEAISVIADKLIAESKMDPQKANELAAAMAGVEGVKINRMSLDLGASGSTEKVVDFLEKNPELKAAVVALLTTKGK